MNIEEQIINDLSQQLANDMDQHILIGFMIDLGWSEVIVDPWTHNSLTDIKNWIKENVSDNQWMYSGNRWVFEDSKHATMFALKWG